MDQVLEEFSKIGIIPVIALEDAADAEPLAKALIDGGLPCAEVTFRTDAAEESIRIMAETYPQMLVGAGTVLTIEQVDRAVNAGAKFIVSPGINPKVVSYCVKKKIPVMPGCANPSDIELAMELGRLASSASWGLPNTAPSTSTTVSQPMTTASGCCFATARHLPMASCSTSCAGVGAVTALSSKSLTQTVKSVVYRESSSRLRGLPEAKIK